MVERRPEIHSGEVTKMDGDFTYVTITNPDGQEYEQAFDTEFLQEAGISAGDRIQLTFTKGAEAREANVNLRIKGLGPARTVEEIQTEIEEIMQGVDLDLIRKQFGSHL